MKQLSVALGDRSYPIYIGPGLMSDISLLQRHIRGQQVMIVTNDTIAPLYLPQVAAALEGKTVEHIILPDGEKFKNLDTLNRVFDALLANRFNRTVTLLALGGGVIGDMTGFAASCYQRGVDFVQVPTTLLSQVDSSVGGKTGVNHPMGKNMIGAFYQPRCVLIDTDSLRSLPDREFSAGMAEVIKYGLIADADFFVWLENNVDALMARDEAALQYAIALSCQTKAHVVAQDEREGGIRAILNLGHTFGHAIETATQYTSYLHGEAVAVGMLMAMDLSRRMGAISEQECQRTLALISRCGLPTVSPQGMSLETYMSLMAVDKKVLDGSLRLVLLKRLGEAYVGNDFSPLALEATLRAFCHE
ncbi:MAG TPA: 3-dehydroquinate synthase [Pseudomonadales bacterium]|nr:3-dehydroquinate synthase [Pseudomonadales bacterium]